MHNEDSARLWPNYNHSHTKKNKNNNNNKDHQERARPGEKKCLPNGEEGVFLTVSELVISAMPNDMVWVDEVKRSIRKFSFLSLHSLLEF